MHLFSTLAHAKGICVSVRLRDIVGRYLQRSRRISTLHPVHFLQRFNDELMLSSGPPGSTEKGTGPDSRLYLR